MANYITLQWRYTSTVFPCPPHSKSQRSQIGCRQRLALLLEPHYAGIVLDNEHIWAASGMCRSVNNNIAHFRTVLCLALYKHGYGFLMIGRGIAVSC